MLVDTNNNHVMGHARVSLAEAEAVGFEHPGLAEQWTTAATAGDKAESQGAGLKVRTCGAGCILLFALP